MATAKLHPSEMLEFASLSPHSLHVENAGKNSTTSYEDTDIGLAAHARHVANDTDGVQNASGATFSGLSQGALAASRTEHEMTLREALRIYPKAVAWSAIISLAIVMEGFDTALITSFYAFPEFEKAYGVPDSNGEPQISTGWQASLSNGMIVGLVFGLFASGALTERFGYRYTILGGLALLAAFVFLSFFAFNIQTLLASQILCGFPWGIFSTLTTAYAAEVMPLNLRGYLTGNVNLCWLLGQVTALGVLRAMINLESPWSFRIPFGLQWVWIVIIFFATIYAPESPWWLIRKGRREQAKKVLLQLTRQHDNINVENILAIMEQTNAVEKKLDQRDGENKTVTILDRTGYGLCFQGANLRRTEIASVIFMIQNMCGLPLIGYAAYFYKQLGFSVVHSFDLTLGMQGLAIIGQLVSVALLVYFERRRAIYLCGLVVMFVILIAAGVVSSLNETQATLWVIAGLIVTFIFVFDATVGPLTYCLIAEIPSTRLRVKTLVLARVAYNINSIVTNILIQNMLNPTAWNWRGKAAFFCALTCVLCFVYCYFRLPETRGLNFHELDILFKKGAPARKFARFQKILERNGYYSFYEDEGR